MTSTKSPERATFWVKACRSGLARFHGWVQIRQDGESGARSPLRTRISDGFHAKTRSSPAEARRARFYLAPKVPLILAVLRIIAREFLTALARRGEALEARTRRFGLASRVAASCFKTLSPSSEATLTSLKTVDPAPIFISR